MDYKKMLQKIVDAIGENAEFEFDDGQWNASSTIHWGDVLLWAVWDSRGKAELVDCIHDVPHDTRELCNVHDWLQEHLWTADELFDYHEPVEETIWEANGFRDEADYWGYKFG